MEDVQFRQFDANLFYTASQVKDFLRIPDNEIIEGLYGRSPIPNLTPMANMKSPDGQACYVKTEVEAERNRQGL